MRSTIREGARAVSQILARESIDLINVHQPLAASAVLHARVLPAIRLSTPSTPLGG